MPRLVAPHLGQLVAADGSALDVEITIQGGPPVLYDAVVVADGDASVKMLMGDADALDFVRQQFRHCKPMLAVGAGADLLRKAGVPEKLEDGSADPSLWCVPAGGVLAALAEFKAALAAHRNFQREVEAVAL